jgi:DICT domain-containing protein
MFEQALKLTSLARPEDLGSVPNISRRTLDEHETITFRAPVPCLEYVSLLIENALLLRTNRTGMVYAGFEKLSRLEPVIDRYLRIADVSEQVYVFGEADWKPPRHPNMKIISFPGHFRLAREWFIIARSHTLHAALVAFDEARVEAPVHEARTFSAFKSGAPAIVAGLATTAEALIDSSQNA